MSVIEPHALHSSVLATDEKKREYGLCGVSSLFSARTHTHNCFFATSVYVFITQNCRTLRGHYYYFYSMCLRCYHKPSFSNCKWNENKNYAVICWLYLKTQKLPVNRSEGVCFKIVIS